MDFDTDAFSFQNAAADSNKHKFYGFGFSKQDRAINDEDLREFKMAKMLSFSSQPLTFPNYHHASNAFGRSAGVRGLFTPSQWMELEHQALIYKYITANVPIPSYLLNPIRKAFDSAGFSVLRSNALGWGGFQLGFSNTDPEPGRCRRTDGKKWRCSRDAVVDQKYCERHMNRGRHRSRKHVEAAHSNANANPNPTSINLQLTTNTIPTHSRGVVDKQNADGQHQHTTAPKATSKDNQNTFQEFGSVCSDSLLNPLNRSSSLVASGNDDHDTQSHHHALRQFIDERPKNPSDYMSSTSSPTNEKLEASPPRLWRELDMGLGVGTPDADRNPSWVPISWGPTPIGGPLGEALHNTSNSIAECSDAKQLNLIDSWDMASSPTGVLQRGPFGSLSNSSAASSPRSSHCNGTINKALMNPSLPAL